MSRHRRCYPHDQDDGGEFYGRCLQTVKYDKTEQDEKQSSRVAERGCVHTCKRIAETVYAEHFADEKEYSDGN